jgi:3-hydroxymyristoyl/3-hydroxydecanoyl-(acyl carrier protein) dehydratase
MLLQTVLLPSLAVFQPWPEVRTAQSLQGSVEGEVHASALVPLCEGHFPDFPVVPGAHLLAIMYDTVVSCGPRLPSGHCFAPSSCVFRELARPDHSLRLVSSAPQVNGVGEAAVVTAWQQGPEWIARARLSVVRGTAREPIGLRPPAGEGTTQMHGSELHSAQVLRLKHRGAALLLRAEVPAPGEAGSRRFASVERRPWVWPLLVDGAAQAAGLCAKDTLQDFDGTLVVVSYEQLLVDLGAFHGSVEYRVSSPRRIRGMLQLNVQARTVPAAEEVLSLRVTLAPLPAAERQKVE